MQKPGVDRIGTAKAFNREGLPLARRYQHIHDDLKNESGVFGLSPATSLTGISLTGITLTH